MYFLGDCIHRFVEHISPSPSNSYRPHLLRRQWLLLFLGVALTAEALLVGNLLLRQAGVPFLAAVVESEVIAHTNVARADTAGAPMLNEHPLLTAAAQAKAADMANKGYFAHVGPDGKEPWVWIVDAGYDYKLAGENLAVRFVDSEDVVEAWMNSPSHRANIVKAGYTDIGVGVASGLYQGEPATYVVQYFAAPQPAFIPGQGAAVASSDSFFNSFTRQVGQYFAEPRQGANWALGLVAAALITVIGISVVRHVQLQPLHALAPGAAVLAVAFTLLFLNSVALTPAPDNAAMGAAVVVGAGVTVEH